MRRKAAVVLMAGTCVVFAVACGGDEQGREAASGRERENGEREETEAPDRDRDAGEKNEVGAVEVAPPEYGNEVFDNADAYEICLPGDGSAEFIFHGGLAEGPDVKEVVYTIDRYEVAFFDYNDTPQCQVMEKGEGVSDLVAVAEYEFRGSDLVMRVNTSDIPKVDLGSLEICSVYYTYGSDQYVFSDLRMGDVLSAGSGPAKPEEADGKPEGGGEQAKNYWFMDQVLDSHGGNWGASHVELSGPDENGLPTIVTVTDSGYDAMGNPLDGVYHIVVDQYEPDEGMDYIIGRYAETPGPGIKGEFFSAEGKVLTLQID